MSDFLVAGDAGFSAVVTPAVPVSIVVTGALQGPQGPTGGIVPITVSATAPSSPNVNDLWIDIS